MTYDVTPCGEVIPQKRPTPGTSVRALYSPVGNFPSVMPNSRTAFKSLGTGTGAFGQKKGDSLN